MKLRITAGTHARRFVSIPPSAENFRPTAERTRQAVANILNPVLHNARVADCCAGSGALGFELLSRGAAFVVFVEYDAGRASALVASAHNLEVVESVEVYKRDMKSFVKSDPKPFDVIFFDPPYYDDSAPEICGSLFSLLAPRGKLVYEHAEDDRRVCASVPPPYLSRRYGDTMIDLYTTLP